MILPVFEYKWYSTKIYLDKSARMPHIQVVTVKPTILSRERKIITSNVALENNVSVSKGFETKIKPWS